MVGSAPCRQPPSSVCARSVSLAKPFFSAQRDPSRITRSSSGMPTRTMPSLPSRPAFMDVDLDENGKIVGLF